MALRWCGFFFEVMQVDHSNYDKELHERAAEVIPGGIHRHYSNAKLSPDIPRFFKQARGSRIWDCEGREYLDFLCAHGSNLFGYANWEIDEAAISQMRKGDTMTGPSPLLVELAEKVVRVIDHAEWVIFCKSGTDALSMAAQCARAQTGKSKVLIALGVEAETTTRRRYANLSDYSEELEGSVYFDGANLQSLEDALNANKGQVAAVFTLPFNHEAICDSNSIRNYARAVRQLCDDNEVLLVLDEVHSGLRLHRGGSWDLHGVSPDLSAWGKTLGNGHLISALVGGEQVREAASKLSPAGPYWYSAVSMAAAIKTIDLVFTSSYLERTIVLGDKLCNGLALQAAYYDFDFRQVGPVQMPNLCFAQDSDFEKGLQWTLCMIQKGLNLRLESNIFFNAAMSIKDIETTLQASEDVFKSLRGHLAIKRRSLFRIV